VSRDCVELLRCHVGDQLLDFYYLSQSGVEDNIDNELVLGGIVYSRVEGSMNMQKACTISWKKLKCNNTQLIVSF